MGLLSSLFNGVKTVFRGIGNIGKKVIGGIGSLFGIKKKKKEQPAPQPAQPTPMLNVPHAQPSAKPYMPSPGYGPGYGY